MKKTLARIGVCAALTAAACAQPPADAAPVYATPALTATAPLPGVLRVWVAESELERLVAGPVAARILAATGLVLETSDDAADLPVFWTTRGAEDGYLGVCTADFVAIDSSVPVELVETVVLHEVLHAFGAEHIESGAGVLSPQIWQSFPLTDLDLVSVCRVRDCAHMVAE